MPFDKVMSKFKHGKLHSGSKNGKKVDNKKQAIAIMMSEKRKAGQGKKEYKGINTGPSKEFMKKFDKTSKGK